MSEEEEDVEIEILNFEDLDVEELEKRLETAAAAGILPDAWCVVDCGLDNSGGSCPCDGSSCPCDSGGCPCDSGGCSCDGTQNG